MLIYSRLFTLAERELEPEQLVLSDVVDHWNRNSNNKIIIKFAKMPVIPSPQLKVMMMMMMRIFLL